MSFDVSKIAEFFNLENISKYKNDGSNANSVENTIVFNYEDGEYKLDKTLLSKEGFIDALFDENNKNFMSKEQLGTIYESIASQDNNKILSSDELIKLANLGNNKDKFDTEGNTINEADLTVFIDEVQKFLIEDSKKENQIDDPEDVETDDIIEDEHDENTNDNILLGGNLKGTDYKNKFSMKLNLIKNWASASFDSDNNANGELDMAAFQGGRTGDCALISACYAIASNETGYNLIKDSISINKNNDGEIESYTVEFKGLEEKYTITAKELQKETNFSLGRALGNLAKYSTGDEDMTLLELAYKKCAKESENENISFTKGDKKLYGVDSMNAFYALTGKKAHFSTNLSEFINELQSGTLSSNTVAQIGFDKGQNVKDVNGKKVKIVGEHAYSISEINKDNVVLKNPWNTGEDIVLSRDTFINLKHSSIVYVDLNEAKE